ncbi:MAG TPA: phytoene/squalene synthase family protein [Gemmatimonadaceae bacterium]|nr:phytoene/squalene synthase family protein [Gemmatimonadaceae bacterium]
MIAQLDDARICAAIARRHARTFTLASRFLPPEKRRAAFAVYAFCRTADDIVDDAPAERADAAAALDDCRRSLDEALAGRPEGAVFRELARAAARCRIPTATLHELVDGVARDLTPLQPATWTELATYCEGVASSVGEMCAWVFGLAGGEETRPAALRYARTLGVAMQLTNILRDVGEDAARGRCYLPDDELTAFGLTRAEVLEGGPQLARDERWRPLLAYEIGRARSLYEAAAPGIALLAPDARRCALACSRGYAAILDAIEALDYDTITRRARVPAHRRAALLVSIWRDRGTRVPTPGGRGPFLRWAASRSTPNLSPLA